MRRISALAFALALAAGPALADTSSSTPAKAPPHAHPLHKAQAKTTGTPLPSTPADPDAGNTEQGTPNTNVTNGSDLAHG